MIKLISRFCITSWVLGYHHLQACCFLYLCVLQFSSTFRNRINSKTDAYPTVLSTYSAPAQYTSKFCNTQLNYLQHSISENEMTQINSLGSCKIYGLAYMNSSMSSFLYFHMCIHSCTPKFNFHRSCDLFLIFSLCGNMG